MEMRFKISSAKWRPFCLMCYLGCLQSCYWHRNYVAWCMWRVASKQAPMLESNQLLKFTAMKTFHRFPIKYYQYYHCPLFNASCFLTPAFPDNVKLNLSLISSQSELITVVRRRGEHDDVIKWKHFPRYWPFVRGIHRSPVNSLHKGEWRGAVMFSLICVWINGWVNNREAGYLRRHRAHYDVNVMIASKCDMRRYQLYPSVM